ncbi:uncharacterized protein LOC121238320 [Juglans microcarpa x Juglans regia]|uniref:uncharacterized protein LOC121238320 n=1 Tax=Juglans microcarpa x Juglans regia TaxID=2249226 RepID=UPI001B7E7955|nr:uncharacterized protein LOC121238320 [Juglans microcarpa x Juglans regia]
MNHPNENNGWMSVPQFGGWDHTAPGATDYSVVFSRARANRKQKKTDLTDFKRNSIGTERELINPVHHQDDQIMRKKKILTYINCCIRP